MAGAADTIKDSGHSGADVDLETSCTRPAHTRFYSKIITTVSISTYCLLLRMRMDGGCIADSKCIHLLDLINILRVHHTVLKLKSLYKVSSFF